MILRSRPGSMKGLLATHTLIILDHLWKSPVTFVPLALALPSRPGGLEPGG